MKMILFVIPVRLVINLLLSLFCSISKLVVWYRKVTLLFVQQLALYCRSMPNSVDFYKGGSLHVILVRIMLHHSHKKQIVWEHGSNWPFYVLMLRTKLYQNSFFFTEHQNVNKPKSRAARTVYGLIFLPFLRLFSAFFFFMSRCKQNKIKLCYKRLQSVKETQTNTV